jgi:predicted homoserine dehydrogenase-like protein
MNFETLLESAGDRTVRVALTGAGDFGRSFLFQALRIKCLDVPVVINRTPSRAVKAYVAAGVSADDVIVCESIKTAKKAYESGKRVVVADSDLVKDLPLDVLVEGTGHPETGAIHAVRALESGWHIIMVSKEVDSVVGPELASRAKTTGRVYSPADGDQPSLLIGLVSWARVLGLKILSAGKASEYDFIYDPSRSTVTANDKTVAAGGMANLWVQASLNPIDLVKQRRDLLADLPQRAVPDLCEMGIVANATGMKPDTPSFHAAIARIVEVPDFFCPAEMGGLLSGSGKLDIFNCLRKGDEASMGGGVFIVVECEDRDTWQVLMKKGHPCSRNNRCAMLYHPAHLLGVEAPMSVLLASCLGMPTGASRPKPVCDLVGKAIRDLPAGFVLEMGGHHHTIEGVEAQLIDAAPMRPGNAAPFYMLANRRLVRPVSAGSIITTEGIEIDTHSVLAELRKAQDERFFVSSPQG